MNFKQSKNEIDALDNRAMKKMLKRSRGFERLTLYLQDLDSKMDLLMYKIFGQSLKYDLYMECTLGNELREAFKMQSEAKD